MGIPALALAAAALAANPVTTTTADVSARLAAPPDEARAMVRWWWFGPSVVKPELEREMRAMKAGGYGGFEIQPVYPMELDDGRGVRNVPYMSPEFLDTVSFVNRKANALKLRVDMTLASGWPYGGPHVPVTQAAGRLRMSVAELPAGATYVSAPAIMSGEKLLATFIGATDDALTPLEGAIAPSASARVVVSYIASRTGQQVKRPALGAEGFVLDHLSKSAVERHLDKVAGPLLKAFGNKPPYAVFSDSLEAYGTDWTDDFSAEFKRRRGYDITPYLPQVMKGQGADAGAVRRDWGLTQTELVNERYLTPINNWARAHKTRFRSQTYGEPAVSMSSNRLVDLPEGEGPQFRTFSFTRLATSGAHLYKRPVISAETWTWLHSPAFNATPLDMKAEADRMLLQGVNQFVGHGWPYTPPEAAKPGYAFYAAAVFNDANPWWSVMPDVNAYLHRMSYLMRQGAPANDVAVFLPNDDVYAGFVPGKASLSAEMHKHVTPQLIEQILDAGHNLDYVDAESVSALGVTHPVLVMPHVTRLSPAVIAKLADYVRGGGKIIAVGSTPSLAPGLIDAKRISNDVAAASRALFAMGPAVQLVAGDAQLGAALEKAIEPDMRLSANASDIGFVRRALADGDIYFIANTSNRDVTATASFRAARAHAVWWNPDNGQVTSASRTPELKLAPYESRVLVLTDKPQAVTAVPLLAPPALLADLSRDWRIRFPGAAQAAMPVLRSWTDDAATRYFSGEAVYSKEVELAPAQLKGSRISLDFGPGTPLATTPKVPAGMRAMLDSPVREAAVVFVNGKRAGALWHPPYVVDVTQLLRPGRNQVEVRVANLALNARAGRSEPDYRLLSARFGQRFIPQDTALVQPQPSGMLGPVLLMEEKIK
jgi:hypothetical protein